MPFQQELWLILVGLVVAFVLHRSTAPNASLIRMSLWASIFSLVTGILGMLSTLFFPSNLIGLLVTIFAALLGAKFGAKRGSTSRNASKTKPVRTTTSQRNKK